MSRRRSPDVGEKGEAVEQGKPIAMIETEKVEAELESPANGTLVEVKFKDGESAPVGEIIAYVDADSVHTGFG